MHVYCFLFCLFFVFLGCFLFVICLFFLNNFNYFPFSNEWRSLDVTTVVLCQKAASWNNSRESAKRQAKQCQFTWGGQWKHPSATTIICQCHKEASLNNSSGEIKPTERQWKWRKFKWRVNENMQGKDVQAASETNLGFRFCGFPSLRTTPWISRRTLSEEHVPLWAQIWFTNDVRNQCSKLHYLERGYRFGKVPSLTSC